MRCALIRQHMFAELWRQWGWPCGAEGGLSPLLMEHEQGGSGLLSPLNARRWHWLPVSPQDDLAQWAQADAQGRYPLPGRPPVSLPLCLPTRACLRHFPAVAMIPMGAMPVSIWMRITLHSLYTQPTSTRSVLPWTGLCLPGDQEGPFWQRPWRLRAAVVHGWRAHRQRLTAIAAHPDELLVATAGRGHVGGQDQDVVRCWNLADTAAGVPSPPPTLLSPFLLGTTSCYKQALCGPGTTGHNMA